MPRVAILSAQGLGDALLMMIASHQLIQEGHSVTFYHHQPDFLKPLFPHVSLSSYPPISDLTHHFTTYDLILIENDHSEYAWALSHLRSSGKLPQITFFFPSPSKHSYAPQITSLTPICLWPPILNKPCKSS